MFYKDIKAKTPLFKEEWLPMYNKLRENQYAPKWNTNIGDRLTASDIIFIKEFEEFLYSSRNIQSDYPNRYILKNIKKNLESVIYYQNVLKNIDLEKDFFKIKLMEKRDIQIDRIDRIIPLDADINRMVVNPTSGTTGNILYCPNEPKSVGCYDPLIQYALSKHGLNQNYNHDVVAAIQLCSQESTITYSTVHSYLNGAGFAKINLNLNEWREPFHPLQYIKEMSPVFFSGDPFAFYQSVKMGIDYKPRILLSTAISLEDPIYSLIKDYYDRPIVDFYSLNETGPIAYSCPLNKEHLHLISPDIYIETVDQYGNHINNGRFGELVFTGGRNSFLPLLRYKTGDYCEIDYLPCCCGEKLPTIKKLSGRGLVLFYTPSDELVNPIDISKILGSYPVLVHKFIQRADYSCDLYLKLLYAIPYSLEKEISLHINSLFKGTVEVRVNKDLEIDKGKIIPYICEVKR